MPVLDAAGISSYIQLFGIAMSFANTLKTVLKENGVTEDQLAAITADYSARIARRESEAAGEQ